MSKILAIVLFLSCSLLLKGEAVPVHIGALINPNSRIAKEQRVAIEIAVQDFNSLNNLSLDISDSSRKAERLLEGRGAKAIISTLPWPESIQIATIATTTSVPLLSLTTSQPLTPKPNIFHMSLSASSYVQCLADLVKLFNWRQVITVYEEDTYGSISAGIIPLLTDALLAVGADISAHVGFPPLDSTSNPKGLIHQELEQLKPSLCKVFIIVKWSSSLFATELFKEASALGMMDKGHVWIAGDHITTLISSTFTPDHMQGVIGIKPYLLHKSRKFYRDFRTKFRQRLHFEPGMHAFMAYDAVHVIAHTSANVEEICATEIVGLSGQVRFKKNGSLMETNVSSAFQIINFVGETYRHMGFWLKGKGFYKKSGAIVHANSFGTIYWPGGESEKIPGGWRKLKIGVPLRVVFDKFVKVEYDSENKVKDVSGFCIDVYKKARELLNYDLPYEFFPFNGTYDELVASIPENFDAVVGDVTICTSRMENVTFTEPVLPSGLSMVVRVEPKNKQWVLTKPFSRKVWLLIAITYFYTCVTVWYLERRQNPEFRGPWRQQVGATLWLIFCTIFFAHGKIHSYYTKAVIAVWLFVLLILTSIFTASLGSILVTEKLEPVVNYQRIGCNGASFVVKYLQDVLGYKEQQIVKITKPENYDTAFQSGEITMAYLETPYVKVFLSRYESSGYTVYGNTQRLGGIGFVSDLLPPFS